MDNMEYVKECFEKLSKKTRSAIADYVNCYTEYPTLNSLGDFLIVLSVTMRLCKRDDVVFLERMHACVFEEWYKLFKES